MVFIQGPAGHPSPAVRWETYLCRKGWCEAIRDSFRTGRPVEDLLFIRLRNSLVLAGIAFLVVMPLALVLGIIAGLREGKTTDKAPPSAA